MSVIETEAEKKKSAVFAKGGDGMSDERKAVSDMEISAELPNARGGVAGAGARCDDAAGQVKVAVAGMASAAGDCHALAISLIAAARAAPTEAEALARLAAARSATAAAEAMTRLAGRIEAMPAPVVAEALAAAGPSRG